MNNQLGCTYDESSIEIGDRVEFAVQINHNFKVLKHGEVKKKGNDQVYIKTKYDWDRLASRGYVPGAVKNTVVTRPINEIRKLRIEELI